MLAFFPFWAEGGVFGEGGNWSLGEGGRGEGGSGTLLLNLGQARALPLHEGLRDPSFREGEGEGR